MSNFELFHTISLSNFIVNIYCIKDYNPSLSIDSYSVVDKVSIDALIDVLNTKEFPRGVVETLENLAGIAKIEVSDYDNNILLNSEVFI